MDKNELIIELSSRIPPGYLDAAVLGYLAVLLLVVRVGRALQRRVEVGHGT